MSKRSFFEFKGLDCADESFVDRALAALTKNQLKTFNLEETQHHAWIEELSILTLVGEAYPDCTMALEYMIPRMGKRVDAVILFDHCAFVVEFKIGEKHYLQRAIDQTLDYCFDLKNFHSESHSIHLIPLLVCTGARRHKSTQTRYDDNIFGIQLSNGDDLIEILKRCINCVDETGYRLLNHRTWLDAHYDPTPTIIEAAQALYGHHKVEDISRKAADLTDIVATTQCIEKLIDKSRLERRKSICFVTGVPGAGKTLVGLNLASSQHKTENESSAVFLSGNGPLIEVLQAALTEDQVAQLEERKIECRHHLHRTTCNRCPDKRNCSLLKTKGQIESEVKAFIQIVHHFREELFISDTPPIEHVAIFDEAQRAWTEEWLHTQMRNRRRNRREVHKSEPHCLIEYMDRHEDWACMVCLVGGGQEINSGEAGITEWLKALRDHFPSWDVYVSGIMSDPNYLGTDSLRDYAPNATVLKELHLSVDMRSFRNVHVAAFADAIVENDALTARSIYDQIKEDYPIFVTRNLDNAKRWVRSVTKRPSDRYGIIADSFGQRIRGDGVIVPMDFNAVKWFLRGKDEIDSSYFMEIAASEFKIQGLEIDYAVVAWEGDYRYREGSFSYHRFTGGKWQNVNSEMRRRYLKNGYRVLLTRARQGYVIYVPTGSDHDPTRKPEYYDETYAYLKSIGIRELPELDS